MRPEKLLILFPRVLKAEQLGVWGGSYGYIVLCAFAYWLVSHPFQGLYHDAVIYAAMAVRWIDPAPYARDLFFLYGSQDGYSIFSPVFGGLISWFGLPLASQLIVLLGALIWICASLWMARHIFPSAPLVGAACVFVLSASSFNYSPNGSTFVLNEGFATARSLAQPLAMLSLAFGISQHVRVALFLAILATLLHPLIGIWSCLIWWVASITHRQLCICVGIAGVLGGLAIYSGRFEFLGLMPRDWFDVVYGLNDVLPKPTQGYRLNDSLFWIAALCIGAKWGGQVSRRWYRATALVTSWGVLVAILASAYPIVILVQAQLWRVLWVAYVLGVFALAEVVLGMLNRSARNIVRIGVVLCLILSLDGYGAWILLGVVVGLQMSLIRRCAGALELYLWGKPIFLFAMFGMAALFLAPGGWISLQTSGGGVYAPWFEFGDVLKGLVLTGGFGVFFLVAGWTCTNVTARRFMLPILVPFAYMAAFYWDARLPSAKNLEDSLLKPGLEELATSIRKGDVVLWPGQIIPVWFILRTASYASAEQTTGVVFSYEKLRESRRRQEIMALAMYGEKGQKARHIADFSFDRFGLDGVQRLCEDTALDWVVLKGGNDGFSPKAGLTFQMGLVEYFAIPCKWVR